MCRRWERGYAIIVHEFNKYLAGHNLSIRADAPEDLFTYREATAGANPTDTWLKRIGYKLNDSCKVFRHALLGIRSSLSNLIADDFDFPIWSLGYPDGTDDREDFIFGRDLPTPDCFLRDAFRRYDLRGIGSRPSVKARRKWKREIVDPIERHALKIREWFDQLEPEPILGEVEQDILIALLELEAIEPNSRKTTGDILVSAGGAAADENEYKRPLQQLKKSGLISSHIGRSGGYWLTDRGRRIAESLRGSAGI